MAGILISAAHKSSGKTSISVGLAGAIARNGTVVQTFKKGPDYIDPLWLGRAAGQPCFNLDFFTMTHDDIRATFTTRSAANAFNLIEGNKGLFDGLDVDGTDSNAALATLLSVPVVLVIDCHGMTRGIAPLITGYLDFDADVDVRGVILNKVGGARHESKLRAAVERYTDIEVLGAVSRDKKLEIPERHLGLIPANESRDADKTITRLSEAVASYVNVDRILEIAGSGDTEVPGVIEQPTIPSADIRIAIARDAAFCFYYQDDLDAFAKAGAELVPFDTLRDTQLPQADGLFIGGGFPETHLAALSGNTSLIKDIRQSLAAGMPAYAECGGLMYLSRKIAWNDESAPMVGAVPGDIVVAERPQGRGYVILEETGNSPWTGPGTQASGLNAGIPAHEFHYAQLNNLDAECDFAHMVVRGHGIDGKHDGLVVGNLQAGFTHQRNTVSNPWVSRFVSFVRNNSNWQQSTRVSSGNSRFVAVFLLLIMAVPAPAEEAMPGEALVSERSKGNCLACHVIDEGVLPGDLGPPLVLMKTRFPDREKLRLQIHDATLFNRLSRMPPFGRHRILTEQEIELIIDYLYTL